MSNNFPEGCGWFVVCDCDGLAEIGLGCANKSSKPIKRLVLLIKNTERITYLQQQDGFEAKVGQ